ncbi:MAG: chorismate mutase [Bacteroidetes bacterium]|nr:chorismate mutase [Bacteroidota bacterium]
MTELITEGYIHIKIGNKQRNLSVVSDFNILNYPKSVQKNTAIVISKIENITKLKSKGLNTFLVNYNLIKTISVEGLFEGCNLILTQFPFGEESKIFEIKTISFVVVVKINSAKNLIEKLKFCIHHKITAIVDVRKCEYYDWQNWQVEVSLIGVLYNLNPIQELTSNAQLQKLRQLLYECDKKIYKQFNKRMEIINEIGKLKQQNSSIVFQPIQFVKNIQEILSQAEKSKSNFVDVLSIYQTLHDISVEKQKKII